MIEKEKFFRGNGYVDELKEYGTDLVVLAGFLWKIPQQLINAYRHRIINIHPALLPKYGGKGFYGEFVHKAVIDNHEKESGITIHYVDEHYDNGDIILQVRCPVLAGDTPAALAERIHRLEHLHYPQVVEREIGKIADGKRETWKAVLVSGPKVYPSVVVVCFLAAVLGVLGAFLNVELEAQS